MYENGLNILSSLSAETISSEVTAELARRSDIYIEKYGLSRDLQIVDLMPANPSNTLSNMSQRRGVVEGISKDEMYKEWLNRSIAVGAIAKALGLTELSSESNPVNISTFIGLTRKGSVFVSLTEGPEINTCLHFVTPFMRIKEGMDRCMIRKGVKFIFAPMIGTSIFSHSFNGISSVLHDAETEIDATLLPHRVDSSARLDTSSIELAYAGPKNLDDYQLNMPFLEEVRRLITAVDKL